MNDLHKAPKMLAAVLAALALTAAACGSSDNAGSIGLSSPAAEPAAPAAGPDAAMEPEPDEPAAPEPPPAAPEAPVSPSASDLSDISGTVNISGSSTVEPISVRVSELFQEVAPNVDVNVDGPGTGDGFKLFCEGETDISDASRQIKPQENAACVEAGIEWIELRVGIDGIAVMTNENNSAVECLSFEDLYAIVGPESVGFDNWSTAGELAAELGSSTSFSDMDLDITAPGTESGTYDSFIEIVIEDIGDARAESGVISEDDAATTRPDYRSAADDNVIISGIQDTTGSFGWVGFAYSVNADGVKLLEVDGGDGCVAATSATIASGEYPVSRSLYIYVNAGKARNNPALKAYVDFYMSDSGLRQAVDDVGYVQLTSDAMEDTKSNWTGMVIGN